MVCCAVCILPRPLNLLALLPSATLPALATFVAPLALNCFPLVTLPPLPSHSPSTSPAPLTHSGQLKLDRQAQRTQKDVAEVQHSTGRLGTRCDGLEEQVEDLTERLEQEMKARRKLEAQVLQQLRIGRPGEGRRSSQLGWLQRRPLFGRVGCGGSWARPLTLTHPAP